MESINKILVATDFSSNGAKAVNYGATLATQVAASLTVLHVEDDRQKNYLSHLSHFESYEEYVKEQFEVINENYLNFKHMDHTFFTRKGIASQTIVEVGEEIGSDLIIVGISGLSKGFELEFGSVTLKVLNQLKCPIIVVPETYQSLKLETIIVATDQLMPGTERDTSLINYFVGKFDPKVYLVNVGEQGEVNSEDYRKLIRKTAPFRQDNMVLVKNEEIIDQLINEVKKIKADLMVIFRRKKSLSSGTFMPRLSNLIALNMTVPILFIPCEASESDDENHADN